MRQLVSKGVPLKGSKIASTAWGLRLLGIVLIASACSRDSAPAAHDGGTRDLASPPLAGPQTRDVVDPGLPSSVVQAFDAQSFSAGGVSVVYPNDRAVIPHDLAAIDVQWNGPSTGVFRVTFAVDDGNRLRGYVSAGAYRPAAQDWSWLRDRAAGHTVQITVEGGVLDTMGTLGAKVASAAQMLRVSRDDATGALFYFATTGDQTTGDGTLERLEVGSAQADPYLNKSNSGGSCVGCHALSRDGSKISLAYTKTDFTLGLVAATDPTKSLAPAEPAASSTFNPDGTRLLTSFGGRLVLRDGVTGAKLKDIATSGTAFFPDWSPDGKHVVFVRGQSCATPLASSVFVYGGSLVTMAVAGDDFAAETVVVAASGGENNYYPTYSPDGRYIAFTRAQAGTKSSWPPANSACGGKDGSGISYDNRSAATFLLSSDGGAPIELKAANGAALQTNSWPKWGPKADGEYMWLLFSSTRPYGNVLAGASAHHQLWITAVPRLTSGLPAVDAISTPAVWFPFQNLATKNHIGSWSLKVGDYVIL